MCGIGGFSCFDRDLGGSDVLTRMADQMVHRGPDAAGVFREGAIGLCHRRLSIIDLSSAANQPMISSDGRLVMVFNGEIYNFQALKRELEAAGHGFATQSDSEVLLAAYAHWGVSCLDRLNGMFAFAIWDRRAETLFIARDRLGKKPLYYTQLGGDIAFASELKALMPVPGFDKTLRPESVRDFFAYQYIPDPHTIFRGTSKLPPAHYLLADRHGVRTVCYWTLRFGGERRSDIDTLGGELLELLDDSTRIRLESDVPLGAFLSGGVDSSAVVASMAQGRSDPITTCSIGFASEDFDEVGYAREIADRFATRHRELTVKDDLPSSVPRIARYFDEPFADPSLVPTYFVCRLARREVKVALSGDGGDENFAGYQKYSTDAVENAWRENTPSFLRGLMPASLVAMLERSGLSPLRRGGTLLRALAADPATAFYHTNAFMRDSEWSRLVSPAFASGLGDYDPADITREHYRAVDAPDHLSRVLYADIKTFLAGGILVKVDRASMANSLEVRAPLLDYRIVEFAARLDSGLKLRGEQKKFLLREAMRSRIPDSILDRRKMGFSVPLADWMAGPLRRPVQSSLFSPDSGLTAVFAPYAVDAYWDDVLAGRREHATSLWSMYMFELWWQQYMA